MNFDYIFLLNNFYSDQFIPPVKNIIIPWSDLLFKNKKKYFLKLNNHSFNFCFAINQKVWPFNQPGCEEEALNSIINFLFLPNYLKIAGAYLLATDIPLKDNTALQKDWQVIENFLGKQGVASISVNSINKEDSETEAFFYSAELEKRLEKNQAEDDLYFLLNELIKNNAAGKKIIIPVNSEKDFFEKQKMIQNFEKKVIEKDPNLFSLLSVSNRLNADNNKLLNENKKLKFHLTNHHDYLKILRETTSWHVNAYNRMISTPADLMQPVMISGSDPDIEFKFSELQKHAAWLQSNRDEILKWYTNEYEILPLWYKRFGHIIKVFKGKRSFKSLFK